MDSAPEVEQDAHHHHHRGDGDHRVADQGHLAQLFVERFGPGRAGDDPLGQDVIHRRRKEEGAGQEVGGAQQTQVENIHQPALLQSLLYQGDVDHLLVVQHGTNQRVAGAGRDQHRQPEHARHCRFLDGQPLVVQLQQTNTAGQQHADHTQRGDKVELAILHQFEHAPANR